MCFLGGALTGLVPIVTMETRGPFSFSKLTSTGLIVFWVQLLF